MEHDLETVLSAAVAAQRINGSYVRRDQATEEHPSNSALMFRLLEPSVEETLVILPEDQEQSKLIMEYLSHKLMDLVAGNLEDYWKNAVMLLDLQSIKTQDFGKLGFIASMPTSYNNAMARDRLQDHMRELAESSRHFGNVGDAFGRQNVAILGSVYSRTYNKHYHTALTQDNNMIRFPANERQQNESIVTISGKIHKHGDNNTTVLHYVKIHK
jgi:hypothetical protein